MIWTPKMHMRRRRGILEESNLNFPPEAALISINFLTFAVFLIKLVMVSISKYYHIIFHYTIYPFSQYSKWYISLRVNTIHLADLVLRPPIP